MKKIDLHIHTVSTVRDSSFVFSLDALKRYVTVAGLDAIAITNHDRFDGAQFRLIQDTLSIPVFPGIEVAVGNGHVLVIGDPANVADFEAKTREVAGRNVQNKDSIPVDELVGIFSDLSEYLVIPHYEKKPSLSSDALQALLPYVSAGEVDSPKKFVRAIKDSSKLTPVLFSDVRISEELASLPTRQTYIDCGDVTVGTIRACLQDKGKVTLSQTDGNRLFQVFDDGQKLSTGLNVLLGERSSGKTYTLDKISVAYSNVKYIRQFSLVQQDDKSCERDFNKDVEKRRGGLVDRYLSGFKNVLDDVISIELKADDKAVEEYIATLLKSAREADRQDAYSKTVLFDEAEFPLGSCQVLDDLIGSVRQVIENVEYRSVIERHVELASLRTLACELIELYWKKLLERRKKDLVNGLVRDVKQSLRIRTSAVQVHGVDLYQVRMNAKKVERFNEICHCLQKKEIISKDNILGFRIEARKGPYLRAGEIKAASGVQTAFSDAFKQYANPYEYLQALLSNQALAGSGLYKLFAKISYRIINRDGFELSGGERSEFRLLQEIRDAQLYDMLLIDEPESSFDNMFLNSDVNQLVREISDSMPVVVVTHNSTVGGSVDADYLLCACKERDGENVVYRLYSGYPTDSTLLATDGARIRNHDMMMNALEAGEIAYDQRRKRYEAIND